MNKNLHLQKTVWTALFTPFLPSGAIDWQSLEKLVDFQKRHNTGILLFGSTGEGLSLSFKEKKEVLGFVRSRFPGTIMWGLAPLSQAENESVLEDRLPVDAYLLASPVYLRPGVYGQTEWFRWHLDHAHVPVMLYNIPSRTGVAIPSQAIENLLGHPQFFALKEASGNTELLGQWVRAYPEVNFYSGDDDNIAAHRAMGAKGVVSVVSNAFAGLSQKFWTVSETPEVNETWKNLCRLFFRGPNPVAGKVIAKSVGLIDSAYVRPPLSDRDLLFPDVGSEAVALAKNLEEKLKVIKL